MKVVHLICAARPNFMKIAPLYHALKKTDWCKPVLVHAQQHTDPSMGAEFLDEFNLGYEIMRGFHIGQGTHAEQTGNAMMFYERVCAAERPDAIVVPGDVNTSMACALVGAKLGIPVVHLEAGLRSFDRSMPEEINRVVIDSVSDLLLTPSEDANDNLLDSETSLHGVIERVGNIMIDAFEMLRPQIEAVPPYHHPHNAYAGGDYAVVTLHRPSNVDSYDRLHELWSEIAEVAEEYMPVVFPVHPRTKKQLKCIPRHPRIDLADPMPYIPFMALVRGATIVITDSGGVQEETSYLGVPCATVRDNTERPITISHGTNELITPAGIVPAAKKALAGEWKSGIEIPLWDGHAAERCVAALRRFMVQSG